MDKEIKVILSEEADDTYTSLNELVGTELKKGIKKRNIQFT